MVEETQYLEARDIEFRYGESIVIDQLSIRFRCDSITGLIGPNGAGKSTLFSVLSGFMPPSRGEVFYFGKPMNGLPPDARARRGVVRTFQVPREFRHLSVLQNMLVAASNQPGESLWTLFFDSQSVQNGEKRNLEYAWEWLRFLKLDGVAEVPAGSLSGGQKKLLELGRVLMLNPRCVMLDEPFAGVNPVLIEQISDRIAELHTRGIGFVIVEHNLHALSRLVQRLVVMDRGTLLAEGIPEEVLRDENVRGAYLGSVETC